MSAAVRSAQRQRNLDAFIQLAVEYEQHCESQHAAASLTGFLFWLETPSSPEFDLQPVVTSGDAVHVLTYHRAKGLEWPIVIAADLEVAIRENLWEARVDLTAPFDVEAPLANRTVRYWPNIFGKRKNGLPVRDAIVDSEEGQRCDRLSCSEERRLAYVGLTRARDAVIVALPQRYTSTGWLDTLGTSREWMLPSSESDHLTLPSGEEITAVCADFRAPDYEAAPSVYQPRWFQPRDRVGYPPATASPSQVVGDSFAVIGETWDIGSRLAVNGDDMTSIGNALHAVIAAALVNPDRVDAPDMVDALLSAHGVEMMITADDALAVAVRLRKVLYEHFDVLAIHAECPVCGVDDIGTEWRGWIDVLVETPEALVIIDHKSSPRPKSEWHAEALSHAGQLACYRRLLATDGRTVLTFIHFVVSGGLIEVRPVSENGTG